MFLLETPFGIFFQARSLCSALIGPKRWTRISIIHIQTWWVQLISNETKWEFHIWLETRNTWFDVGFVEQPFHLLSFSQTVLDKDPGNIGNTLKSLWVEVMLRKSTSISCWNSFFLPSYCNSSSDQIFLYYVVSFHLGKPGEVGHLGGSGIGRGDHVQHWQAAHFPPCCLFLFQLPRSVYFYCPAWCCLLFQLPRAGGVFLPTLWNADPEGSVDHYDESGKFDVVRLHWGHLGFCLKRTKLVLVNYKAEAPNTCFVFTVTPCTSKLNLYHRNSEQIDFYLYSK